MKAQKNLSKYEVFHYAMKRLNGHLFWIKKPFEMQVEEVEWTEGEEMENFLRNESKIVIPFQFYMDEKEKDVLLLFHFRVCQLKNNKTKLTLSALHPVCDGRTIFTIFDLLRRIIKGETLEGSQEKLWDFGGRERYQSLDDSFSRPPEVWDDIEEGTLLPKINPPFQHVTVHYFYDYMPVAKFCKDHKVSVQAMLMAMLTRAARKYNHLPKDTPIRCNTPCDTRASSHATETYRQSQFYCNAGSIYPKVVGQETLMDDIEHCMEKLLESKTSHDDVRQLVNCGGFISPTTFKFIPNGRFPDPHSQRLINVSNIGRVQGDTPLFNLTSMEIGQMYNFFYHAYHTPEKLIISRLTPKNFDPAYLKIIKEEMDKIFIPEKY